MSPGEQLVLEAPLLDLRLAREIGMAAASAALDRALRVDGFDPEGAGRFIVGWLSRHGPTSGEDLVKQANDHGFRSSRGNRCFGAVFKRLLNAKSITVLRSDLRRTRGHGTSGGKLYEAGR